MNYEADNSLTFYPRKTNVLSGTTLQIHKLEDYDPSESSDFMVTVTEQLSARGRTTVVDLIKVISLHEHVLTAMIPTQSFLHFVRLMLETIITKQNHGDVNLLKIHATPWGSFQLNHHHTVVGTQILRSYMILVYMNPDFHELDKVATLSAVNGTVASYNSM